jgi:hypothetical protein
MFTVEELKTQYEAYTDSELFDLYHNLEAYSAQAAEAVNMVIEKRGGLDALQTRVQAHRTTETEKLRIEWEVKALSRKGVDIDLLKSTITSKILPAEEVHAIIDVAGRQLNIEKEDQAIKPRTIIGGLAGALTASVIGGILWGLKLIYQGQGLDHKVNALLAVGLVLVCYGIIRLFTRQSRRNIMVLVFIGLSVLASVFIGITLYRVIGPR